MPDFFKGQKYREKLSGNARGALIYSFIYQKNIRENPRSKRSPLPG